MIAHVRGTVAAVTLTSAVVEVGGIGLELRCTPGTLADLRVGQQAQVATSMVVREDSLTLFGFSDEDEKQTFELLQTASGVGPKLAQAVLAVLTPDEVRIAVGAEDVKTLTKVPGIGQKGAQRLILELRDRLGPARGAKQPATPGVAAQSAWRDQVTQGLLGLGWSAKEADKAVESVAPQADEARAAGAEVDVAALLRAALRTLSKA